MALRDGRVVALDAALDGPLFLDLEPSRADPASYRRASFEKEKRETLSRAFPSLSLSLSLSLSGKGRHPREGLQDEDDEQFRKKKEKKRSKRRRRTSGAKPERKASSASFALSRSHRSRFQVSDLDDRESSGKPRDLCESCELSLGARHRLNHSLKIQERNSKVRRSQRRRAARGPRSRAARRRRPRLALPRGRLRAAPLAAARHGRADAAAPRLRAAKPRHLWLSSSSREISARSGRRRALSLLFSLSLSLSLSRSAHASDESELARKGPRACVSCCSKNTVAASFSQRCSDLPELCLPAHWRGREDQRPTPGARFALVCESVS